MLFEDLQFHFLKLDDAGQLFVGGSGQQGQKGDIQIVDGAHAATICKVLPGWKMTRFLYTGGGVASAAVSQCGPPFWGPQAESPFEQVSEQGGLR